MKNQLKTHRLISSSLIDRRERLFLMRLCLACRHHGVEFFKADLSVSVDVGFLNHLLILIVGKLNAKPVQEGFFKASILVSLSISQL